MNGSLGAAVGSAGGGSANVAPGEKGGGLVGPPGTAAVRKSPNGSRKGLNRDASERPAADGIAAGGTAFAAGMGVGVRGVADGFAASAKYWTGLTGVSLRGRLDALGLLGRYGSHFSL